jgi:membrane protease YdiL (CAAX protease family)
LFFAYAYLRTRQLWLPIGLHIGWNFFEGTIFGFPVSGTTSYQLIHQSVSGPEIITGGAFGPEAGLILLPALLLGTAMVIILTRNRRDQHRSPLPEPSGA